MVDLSGTIIMPLSVADLKALRSLAQKKFRQSAGKIVIEGARLIETALQSSAEVERVICTEDYLRRENGSALSALAQQRGVRVESLTPTQAEQLGQTRSPQGVFAVVAWDSAPAQPIVSPPALIIDGVADPGNVGTLLRTADWFGLATVCLSGDSADLTNPKVVRGGMGAHFHLPHLYQGDILPIVDAARSADMALIGSVLDGTPIDIWLTRSPIADSNWALVVGNEARGLSEAMLKRIDHAVTIGGAGSAESLNVTVAAGIMLHHLAGSPSSNKGPRRT